MFFIYNIYMQIAVYIVLSISILISLIHLVFCFFKLEKLRKITKVFCVGILSIALIIAVPKYPLIYFGAIFGCIGDYFLIKKEKMKSLMFGIIFFLFGHICYAIQLLWLMNTPNWGYPLFALLYLIISGIGMFVLQPKLKYLAHNLTSLGIGYFFMMISSFILTIIYGIVTKNLIPSLMMGIGYLLFISSDTILLYTTYIKKWNKDDFVIMITYLSAEFLITIGLVIAVLGI